MLKRLVRWYVRKRYGDVSRIKPPLGWLPWDRPSVARRIRYVVASRLWRVECRLHRWASPARYGPTAIAEAYAAWWTWEQIKAVKADRPPCR